MRKKHTGYRNKVTSFVVTLGLLFSIPVILPITNSFAATGELAMTQLTLPAGIKAINGIAASSDGTKLVFISGTRAATGSDSAIYTSSDSGITWVLRKSNFNSVEQEPTQIVGSDNGKYLVVTTLFGNVYNSSDFGVTWSQRNFAGAIFCNTVCAQQAIAMSADGSVVALTRDGGTTWYLSTDYGSTWNTRTAPSSVLSWQTLHMSGDGNSIWISQWGNTQTLYKYNRTNNSYSTDYFPGIDVGPGITGSADGTIVYSAGGNYFANGFVFKSTDSGATFSRIGPNKTFAQDSTSTQKTWTKFKASPDGTKLIGVDKSNSVFISLDSGVTWVRQADGVSLGYNDNARVVTSAIFSSDGSTAFVTAGPDDGPSGGPTSWGVGRIYKYSLPKISTTTLTTLNASRTYGASNTLTATISPTSATGTVNFQSGGVSISGCSSTTVSSGVATCTTWKPGVGTYANITAIYSGDGSLTGSTATAISFSVTAAPLSITASSSIVNYGATIPTITASYSGLVNSDISAVVTGQSCSTAYTTTSAVGTSPSTSCSGGSASNYTISYVAGAVTINKAIPTFSSFGNVPKTYGVSAFDLTAPTPSTPGTWTYASGTSSVILLTGISATVAAYGTSVVTATFTPDDAANYVSGGTIAMTVTVSKATLGITASSHTVAFGAAIPTITASYSGFVNGEGSSVLSNLACTTTYTTTTSVGTTGSSCSGATASNYSFAYTAGIITVTQGGQTSALTISSTSVTYGSTLSLTTGGGTGSGSNSFVVDSGPCTVSGSTLSTTAAGTCMVTATKAANGNYLVSSSTSTAITVNPKGLSITGLTGVNKEFDQGVLGTTTGTPTLVGKVGSDDVLLSGTPTFAFGSGNVENGQTLTGSGYTLAGTTAGNYTLTQPTVTANITAKAARIAATNTTVAYGATVTSGFTTSALISPDAIRSASYTYTGTGTSTPPTAVGVYTVTPSNAVFSTGSIGNYTISYDTATVTILAKYTITYNANGGVIGSNLTTSADFVVGDTALALPTATREGFNFLGWFTLESNGVQVSGAYTPSATATLWAHWIQKSLVGVGNSRKIGAITTLADVGNTYSATSTNGTVAVTYVANALPVGTIIDIYQMSDSSRASSIISSTNNYVLSLVIAWLTPTNTVPLLSAADALTMVITDSAIKKGAKVYSLIGSDSTLLGTATADGSVTVRILEDPEVYIAITKPDAPTGVSATSGGNASTTVSWTAPSDGGSAITGYTATSNAGQTCSSTTTTTCSVTGLTNGTSYTFTVTATNTIGTSEPSSASSSATPAAPVVVTPAPSSGGGGAGGGSTYVEPTPTVDPAVAAAALAVQKALAEKAAAEAKVVAAAKAAAEAKVLADKKAADEAELAAIIKALQEQGALEAAAKKVADELVASQLKAEEDLKIATALELAEEQRIAAEKAVALAASKKITTVYSTTAAFKLNKTYTNRLSLYTKKIAAGSTVTCIGYAKSTKTLSYTTAKVVATKQAKALCSSMKKINPTLKTKSVVYPASKAPVTTVNKKWIPVSYRIVSPVN